MTFPHLSRVLLLVAVFASLALPSSANAAEPNPLELIQRLMGAHQHTQALPLLESYAAKNMKDIKGRFLLGITLGELGQDQRAIDTFTKLTEDFPEVPEPYNNLAALYARRGHFDQARQSLEMAIRANPNYAIAQENLGDIYARLAATQYRTAESLDSANKPLAKKREVLETVVDIPPQTYTAPKFTPNSSTSSVPF